MNTHIIKILLAVFTVILSQNTATAEPLSWPSYGPEQNTLRIDKAFDEKNNGLTNAIPDVVGPVDGSARLTIFTEGNHYPILLPVALEAFPAYCQETRKCNIRAQEILVVTLPQVMIVNGLEKGGFRFGNAVIPTTLSSPVFPDLVMLGKRPMSKLHKMGLIEDTANIFAKHRGMGFLVNKKYASQVKDLNEFVNSDLPFVIATPNEAGARNQYLKTLDALVGEDQRNNLFKREVQNFSGRLTIQHRDIPYAMMNEIAPVGIIFGHLAKFYAEYWPDDLAFIEVPEASEFGTEIMVAKTKRQQQDLKNRDVFIDFLLNQAPVLYEKGGFHASTDFAFGQPVGFE